MSEPQNRLIVALDTNSDKEALSLVDQLGDLVRIYKVGISLFTRCGPEIVKALIKKKGKEVFLDLKFHDIPSVVASASRVAASWEVKFLDVHLQGGKEMVMAAIDAVRQQGSGSKVLGVTLLTSFGHREERARIPFMAQEAEEAGLDGVIASAWEAEAIRRACGKGFLLIVPGIRAHSSQSFPSDQKWTSTPQEAIKEGADFIVVGRPILMAKDPKEATRAILKEIEEAERERGVKRLS